MAEDTKALAAAKPKAYSYIRMSTPEQLKGDSLRRQLARSRDYAERHGLELIESFDDLGVSAYRGMNAEFGDLARFKAQVENGEIERGSYLIVESMDRLSRDKAFKAFKRLSDIIDCGIILVTLDDGQVYSEDTFEQESFKLFIALGSMARAHEESKRKSDLLAQTWKGKRKRLVDEGIILTSRVPAWLKADRKKNTIVVIPERVKLVQRIFAETCQGYGIYSIAQRLNKEGIKPWSTRKNPVWRDSYIRKILTSRTVLGEFQAHITHIGDDRKPRVIAEGEPIKNYFPAVIAPEVFQEAAHATALRRNHAKGRKGKVYANLFTGMLRCKCTAGMRYVDKGNGDSQYLRCSVAYAGGPCKAPFIRYDLIETKILYAIEHLDIGKVLGGNSRQLLLVEAKRRRNLLHVRAEEVQTQKSRLLAALKAGEGTLPSLVAELAKLDKEDSELRLAIEAVELEIEAFITINPAQRKKVITDLLTKIRVKGARANVENTRRALAGELLRLISRITVERVSVRPTDVLEIDTKWRVTDLKSEEQIDRNLKHYAFALKILYRNGDVQEIDGWHDRSLKFKQTAKMKQLKTNVRANATKLTVKKHRIKTK